MTRYHGEYFKCLRAILHVMKICGIFPFIFTDQGTTRELLLSRLITVISVLLYFVFLPFQLQFILEITNSLFENFNFNIFVQILPKIISRLFMFSIPFLIWRESRHLHVHWNEWKIFQDELEKVTKAPYTSTVQNKIRFIYAAALAQLLVATAYRSYYNNTMAVQPNVTPFIYLTMPIYLLLAYWCTNCVFVQSVANDMLRFVEKTIETKDSKATYKLIELWMILCNLNEQFSSAHSNLFLIFLSYLITNMVITLYCFVFLLVNDVVKWSSIAYFCYALIFFCGLVVICELANSTFEKVVLQIQEALLQKDTRKMDWKSMRSVLIFLEMIEARKPRITLNGFMVVDRSTILSILGVVINYLVVLKQFATTSTGNEPTNQGRKCQLDMNQNITEQEF